MRGWFVAFCLVGIASSNTYAADLGEEVLRAPDDAVLRGSNFAPPPPTFFNWSGFYVGGQAGYAASGMDFGTSTRDLVAYILRNTTVEEVLQPSTWTTLPRNSTNGGAFGGFVGFNTQWDEAVLGFEVSYNHTSLASSGTDSMSRYQIVGTTRYDVSLSSTASLEITDYASFRGRAGYAMGQFLPYMTVGAVVARANVMRSATVTESETDVTDPNNPIHLGGLGPITKTDVKNGTFIYGFSGGLGMDVMLLPNIFARGEWEYVRFQNISGITANINSARVGLGVKF